jgi:hypothetical protein
MDSTSDDRTKNNVMRHEYRVLSEEEKEKMKKIKDMGLNFVNLLHLIGNTDPTGDRMGSANLTLSMRHMEDAVYRAVKHITG